MLRLTELRLLASRWHVAVLRLEGPGVDDLAALAKAPPKREPYVGKIDVVLQYRNDKAIRKLAERAAGRLRIVDAQSAYFRLKPGEAPPATLLRVLRDLLRSPAETPA
jgi:hypothetical protein